MSQKEYNIKDKVWIHLGEKNLVEGRVVDIVDLEHLGEGHSADNELYIIEIKTGIDDVYEVRNYDQISPDSVGPINLFRNKKLQTDIIKGNRFMKNIGVKIPAMDNPLIELAKEINEVTDADEPTPEQINAALERATHKDKTIFNPTLKPKKPARKSFVKRKKSESGIRST